ncbi:MAG: hypothetical protein WDL87_06170 [Candidatus Omnitrophota bacterium]|jgi:hypothetical protein
MKTILISFLGHAALFGVFSFTFGNRLADSRRPDVNFLGSILLAPDIAISNDYRYESVTESIFLKKISSSFLKKSRDGLRIQALGEIKPSLSAGILVKKSNYFYHASSTTGMHIPKDSVIMFYPLLPQHFTLYFQDRQSAHIELLCIAGMDQKPSSTIIKRKISSGNLEVDLLAMRYIGHYLFIQQNHFQEGTGQTIKIDLSTENK